MDADNLHRRLKKIIGQVQAIDRMVAEDVPCEDILSQINAAKSALNGCGKVVLGGATSATASGTASSTVTRTKPSRASSRRWNASPTCSNGIQTRTGRPIWPSGIFSLDTVYSCKRSIFMGKVIEKIETFMELGGIKKDVALLATSGIALTVSIFYLLLLVHNAGSVLVISNSALLLKWRKTDEPPITNNLMRSVLD